MSVQTLKEKAQRILTEKNTKIIPTNIKNGVQIFDVTGTYSGGQSGVGKLQSGSDVTIQLKDEIDPKYYREYIERLKKVLPAVQTMKDYYAQHSEEIDMEDFWDDPELTEERKQEIQDIQDEYSKLQTAVGKSDYTMIYMYTICSMSEEEPEEESTEEESEEEPQAEPQNDGVITDGELSLFLYSPITVVDREKLYLYIDADNFTYIHDYLEYIGNIDMQCQETIETGWYLLDLNNSEDIIYTEPSGLTGIYIHKSSVPAVSMTNLGIDTAEGMAQLSYLDETTCNAFFEDIESDGSADNIQITLTNVDKYVYGNGLFYAQIFRAGEESSGEQIKQIDIYGCCGGNVAVDLSCVIPYESNIDLAIHLESDSEGLLHRFVVNTDDNINQNINVDISGYYEEEEAEE